MSGTVGDARKRREDPVGVMIDERLAALKAMGERFDAENLAQAAEVCKAAGYRVVKLEPAFTPRHDDGELRVTEEL